MRQTARLREGRSNRRYARAEFLVLTRSVHGMAVKLKLAKAVVERANGICADAAAMDMPKFLPRPALAAAAVCVACREHKVPVTQRDLAVAAGCDLKELGKSYAAILERMHISRPYLNGKSYVHRVAMKRHLPDEVYNSAEETVSRSEAAGVDGRNPMTIAAAALYLAACGLGETVTQAEVAQAAGVAEESVRECCKVMRILAEPVNNRKRS